MDVVYFCIEILQRSVQRGANIRIVMQLTTVLEVDTPPWEVKQALPKVVF